MALQSSGAISLANVQTEFGGANPISISEYYGVGTVPASGTISLNNFYGQTAFSAIWSGNSLNSDTGFETSGNLIRAKTGADTGTWITTYSNATFSSTDSLPAANANVFTLRGSGNTLIVGSRTITDYVWSGSAVYIASDGTLTGSGEAWGFNFPNYLETSGGALRAGYTTVVYWGGFVTCD